MPRGVADVVQVVVLATGAHAALGRGGTHVGAWIASQEDILERHHAGVGEQQGGVVVRYQGARRDDGVPTLLEVAQKGLSDVCTFHEISVTMSMEALRTGSPPGALGSTDRMPARVLPCHSALAPRPIPVRRLRSSWRPSHRDRNAASQAGIAAALPPQREPL